MTTHALRRILVPNDFSQCATAAVAYATFLAGPFGAAVELLYVWNPRTHMWEQETNGVVSECIVCDWGPRPVVRARVEFGELYSATLRVAEEGFDLIVIGVHGHSRLTQLVTGQLYDRLARHAG